MFVKITRATYLSGEPAGVGDIFELDDVTARQVIATRKGIECDAPSQDELAPEPPKPKPKKVGKTKESRDSEKPAEE